MGKIFNLNGVFYIEFKARGLTYHQIAGSHEASARSLLDSIEEKIKNGEILALVRDIPVGIFWEKVCLTAPAHYPSSTSCRLILTVKHFSDFLSARYSDIRWLSEISPRIIENYKWSAVVKKAKPWRINLTLILLREIFDIAVKEAYLNDNPTLHIRLIDDRRPRLPIAHCPREILAKGCSLFALLKFLKVKDILRTMPYLVFLPDPFRKDF